MRTATIQRESPAENSSIRSLAPSSSESTTVGDLPGEPREVARVGAGVGLVGRDDHGARVGDGPAHLGQPAVGGREHARDPLAVRVERRAPRLRGDVLGQRLAQPGADLVAGLGAPAHRAAVGQEDHRAHDVVAQRVAVAVRVVGDAAPDAVAVAVVRARTGSPRCRTGTACRSGPAGGWRPRTPRGPRRPSDSASPPWCTSSRITSVGAAAVRAACSAGLLATCAYVTATPSNPWPCRPWALLKLGSSVMPTRAAASAHWRLRCSVGATTVTRRTTFASSSSVAIRSANVVLPAPGVATARKSRGLAVRYCSIASACQARSLPAVPQGARAGNAGGSWEAADEDAWVEGTGDGRARGGRHAPPLTGVAAEAPLAGRRRSPCRRSASRRRRRPAARAAPRRSPCRPGRRGTCSGPGPAPRPCRRARSRACR